jgi:hypothetical protein
LEFNQKPVNNVLENARPLEQNPLPERRLRVGLFSKIFIDMPLESQYTIGV